MDQLVEQWLDKHPRDAYGLLVLHTHAHGDHVAGDAQFADRPDTLVVDAAASMPGSSSGSAPTQTK